MAYLDEMQVKLAERTGLQVTKSTLHRHLTTRMGYGRRRLTHMTTVADPDQRLTFRHKLHEYVRRLDQLVFFDEASKDRMSCQRAYGYGPIGEEVFNHGFVFCCYVFYFCCYFIVTFINFVCVQRLCLSVYRMVLKGRRFSVIGAYTVDGAYCGRILPDTFNTERFLLWLDAQVIPMLRPYPLKNSILIRDNAAIHGKQQIFDRVRVCHYFFFFTLPACLGPCAGK